VEATLETAAQRKAPQLVGGLEAAEAASPESEEAEAEAVQMREKKTAVLPRMAAIRRAGAAAEAVAEVAAADVEHSTSPRRKQGMVVTQMRQESLTALLC